MAYGRAWVKMPREHVPAEVARRCPAGRARGSEGGQESFRAGICIQEGFLTPFVTPSLRAADHQPKLSPRAETRATSLLVANNVPAQGTPHPNFWQRYFADHAVVRLVAGDAGLAPTALYDPSYGKLYSQPSLVASEVLWEKGSRPCHLLPIRHTADEHFQPLAH